MTQQDILCRYNINSLLWQDLKIQVNNNLWYDTNEKIDLNLMFSIYEEIRIETTKCMNKYTIR